MVSPDELVAAGALLPLKEKLKDESIADTVSARLYQHPALGSRTVVRLVADNLAPGEDLTLDFLGFGAPAVAGPVARRRRQALGFPAWALVNDPKRARYALQLIKGFRTAARKARAKPGHGWDEFIETARQLGTSVAHFLPSYWEQVGREFIAMDNLTYASRAFGKARESEQAHALKVDEATRQDAFLEFTLAGAVSIKALTEYSKELSSTHDPKLAWKFFRELCVRRILGGMPPWPAMFKDLQPLVKAAGLNDEQELQSVLVEIIDSPSFCRAAMTFWDGSWKLFSSLLKQDKRIAGLMLNMIPEAAKHANEIWTWLNHLESWGLLENVWKEKIPAEMQPEGGPTAWLHRLIRYASPPRQRLFDLLEQMSPRLIKDGVPLPVYERWNGYSRAHVDFLDLALELKIPIADPEPNTIFHLTQWANPLDKGTERRSRPRDPTFVAADPRFAPILRKAVHAAAGFAEFQVAAPGKVALRDARHEWLTSLIDELSNGALPRTETSLDAINKTAPRAIFQEFPDQLERLKQAEVLTALTRTIQTGVIDEYGWPALEDLVDSFFAADKQEPLLFGQFPYLIVTNHQRAVVLRGEEIVHEAEVQLPANHKVHYLMFLDGDLLVWASQSYQTICFWNRNPQSGPPSYQSFADNIDGVAIELPGGGTFTTKRVIHQGDKNLISLRPDQDCVFGAGQYWWLAYPEFDEATQAQGVAVCEIDPATNERGRSSVPSFLEEFIQTGSNLEIDICRLLPLAAPFGNSPLGTREGLIGFRSRSNESMRRVESIDGRAAEVPKSVMCTELLMQPGTEQSLPVEPIKLARPALGFDLWDPIGNYKIARIRGRFDCYGHGQVATLPPIYLHAFQLRHPAASHKLRQVKTGDVQKLLDAALRDFESIKGAKLGLLDHNTHKTQRPLVEEESRSFPLLDAAIQALLAADLPSRFLTGLRGIIIQAAKLARQLAQIVTDRESPVSGETQIDPVKTAHAFLSSLQYTYSSSPSHPLSETGQQAARFFRGEIPTVLVPKQWFELIRILVDGFPQKLWSRYCSDPSDQSWIPLAEVWSTLPLQDLGGYFRYSSKFGKQSGAAFFQPAYAALCETFDCPPGRPDQVADWAVPYVGQSSRFLIHSSYNTYYLLEYSLDGQFETIPGWSESGSSRELARSAFWSSQRLAKFVELAKSNPLTIPDAKLIRQVAGDVQASAAEVALVWFGLPNMNGWMANFMPAHLREGCGLKVKDCSNARQSLQALPADKLNSLVQSVLEGEPHELWEQPQRVAARLTAAWGGGKLGRIPLTDEWMKHLTAALGYRGRQPEFLEALNAPSSCPLFSDQGSWSFQKGKYGVDIRSDGDVSEFDVEVLENATVSVALLSYGLPVGDPARRKMAEVIRAMSKVLANPQLLLTCTTLHGNGQKKTAALLKLVESYVGKLQQMSSFQLADDETLAVAVEGDSFDFALRPAKLSTAAQWQRLVDQLLAMSNPISELDIRQSVGLVQIACSKEFTEIAERIENTPVPAGSYETNPALSCPKVVQQVVKQLKLTPDAAVYYLQLLALPDPTDKNVQLWNGWTAATLKTVAAELVSKKRVIAASRARSGRKVFLPGGWDDLKAPLYPLETWKTQMYVIQRIKHQPVLPLSRILPIEPVHSLFAKAWKRIVSGDVPKYEEVK